MSILLLATLLTFRMTTKLINDNTEAFYRISQLYYRLGEEEDSLRYCTRNSHDILLYT